LNELSKCLRSTTLAGLVLAGCGGTDSGGDTNNGGTGGLLPSGAGGQGNGGAPVAGGGGNPTTSGGASGSGNAGGNGGAPLRPPNPRTDMGPPDGTVCSGENGSDKTVNCSVGQQCCPGGVADPENTCVAAGTICQNCTFGNCGAALCDGPEDCPGQLCCFTERSCTGAGAPCTGAYGVAACADRCETVPREIHVVVCRDARDCLRVDQECLPRTALPAVMTCR